MGAWRTRASSIGINFIHQMKTKILKENGSTTVNTGEASDEQTSRVMIGPQLEGPLPIQVESTEGKYVNNDLSANDRKRNWEEAGLEIEEK